METEKVKKKKLRTGNKKAIKNVETPTKTRWIKKNKFEINREKKKKVHRRLIGVKKIQTLVQKT